MSVLNLDSLCIKNNMVSILLPRTSDLIFFLALVRYQIFYITLHYPYLIIILNYVLASMK